VDPTKGENFPSCKIVATERTTGPSRKGGGGGFSRIRRRQFLFAVLWGKKEVGGAQSGGKIGDGYRSQKEEEVKISKKNIELGKREDT